MDPVFVVILIASVASAACWIASLITGDTSWVDRLWSILPAAYVVVFAWAAGFADTRLNVMAILAVAWGARLTFNFARRGGYSGMEDYRWAVVRAGMKPWQFQVFNLLFIVIAQNVLLALIAMPALTAYQHQSTPFGALGALLALAMLACLVGETVADQQQWNFHRRKKAQLSSGEVPASNFCQTGLFRFARHPNYFFELAQWWLLFGIGAAAAGSVLQWTVIGVVLLTLLFIGSTRLTERITLSKYPEYAQYQARTSPIIPWPPRKVPAVRSSEGVST
jgi:steroid 5-alpha reductase family enzyme